MSLTKSLYRVKQNKREDSESENYWNWSIWIDGQKEDLAKISTVVYILHPTFKNRVRTTSAVKSKFKLKSKGWGEFTIFIRIYFKNKGTEPLYLSHDLNLFSKKDSLKTKVFISSQVKDREIKESLKEELLNNGVEVLSVDEIESNTNIFQSIEKSIDGSDVLIMLGNDISRSQMHELNMAIESKKKIYILGNSILEEFKELEHVKSTNELVSRIVKMKK